MLHTHKASQILSGGGNRPPLHVRIHNLLRLVFVRGPKVLFTSQITGLCATLMILLCLPSLIYCALLTVPGLLFYSPEQHAYYYFSRILNEDPGRWIVLMVAAACTIIALALPATMPEKAISVQD